MIKNLFKKLFCCHEWKQVRRINVYKDDDKESLPVRFILLYCCKKCGKFKRLVFDES